MSIVNKKQNQIPNNALMLFFCFLLVPNGIFGQADIDEDGGQTQTLFSFGCGSLYHKTFHIAFLIGANWLAAGGLSLGTPPSKPPTSTNIKMYACLFSQILKKNLSRFAWEDVKGSFVPAVLCIVPVQNPMSFLSPITIMLLSSMLLHVLFY